MVDWSTCEKSDPHFPRAEQVLGLTLTNKTQFAWDEDEMRLCPYCVTFLLDLGCDRCVRSVRSSCTVRRRRACRGIRGQSGLEWRALYAARALQPHAFRVWEPWFKKLPSRKAFFSPDGHRGTQTFHTRREGIDPAHRQNPEGFSQTLNYIILPPIFLHCLLFWKHKLKNAIRAVRPSCMLEASFEVTSDSLWQSACLTCS